MNACGRPKRRAASVSEAATKVMTILDTPVKGNHLVGLSSNKEGRGDGDEAYVPSRTSANRENRTGSDGRDKSDSRRDGRNDKDNGCSNGGTDKEKSVHYGRDRKRNVKPHLRVSREVKETMVCLVDVVATMDRCVHAAQVLYTDHNYALIQPDDI